MDKRIFLAVVLTVAVVALTQFLFPSANPTTTPARSPAAAVDVPPVADQSPATGDAALGSGASGAAARPGLVERGAAAAPFTGPVDSTVVRTTLAEYVLSSRGAAPVSIELERYRSLREGARAPNAPAVELVRGGEPLLSYAVAVPGDTVFFDDASFRVEQGTTPEGAPLLTYRAQREGIGLVVQYAFVPENYLTQVRVQASGIPARAYLMVGLPRGLPSAEADSLDDQGHLAYAFQSRGDGATAIPFDKLDPGEVRLETDQAITWVAAKNKYFIIGLLTPEAGQPFVELTAVGGPRTGRRANTAQGTALLPLGADGATFELYAGPQEWRRLVALGRDFKDSNPYGGFMQGIVQPFATIVMNVLLWMRETLALNYGWVLVIFGVAVRVVLFPLNQKAMRAQLRMQRIQPELQAAQKRFPNDPQKQQQEVMRVYKEHDMSPFSTLSGCLPMLLPMPIFFALFFVFQNTIEFRGVSFLWLEDISLKDPYYILPILMGITTFLMSWIGLRGQKEISQQQKLFAYVFPLTFTFVLLNMASGLNLYYTVQNLAGLPQQWWIARERGKATPTTPVVQGTPVAAEAGGRGGRRRA